MRISGTNRSVERVGVLFPGLGAVATTTIAGALLARKGRGVPVGSLTQLGRMPVGHGAAANGARVSDVVPIATLDELVFGGWDIFEDDAYESAVHADVLRREHLDEVKDELRAIRPMRGAFYREYVKRLDGRYVKSTETKAEMVDALREDIQNFIRDNHCSRAVCVWTGSTESYTPLGPAHASISAFEAGLRSNAKEITASQLYAWACVQEGVPFANGSPNLAVDFPAIDALARARGVALSGKDFKTGQTLMKTVVAPALRARMLGLNGWYSTNILGNRDGEVLDDPGSFKSKELSKLGVLDSILEPESYPELYGHVEHKVRIDYYPPRGDQKEGWDNIDLFGWLGYPMQLKMNFLCRDSILAAPIVLDLALLMDVAQRAGWGGMQTWLGFYFKSPMAEAGEEPLHHLFEQLAVLYGAIRRLGASLSTEKAPRSPISDPAVAISPAETAA